MQLTSRRASRPDERFSRESDVRGHELQTLTTEGDEEGDGHEYIADAAASSVCFRRVSVPVWVLCALTLLLFGALFELATRAPPPPAAPRRGPKSPAARATKQHGRMEEAAEAPTAAAAMGGASEKKIGKQPTRWVTHGSTSTLVARGARPPMAAAKTLPDEPTEVEAQPRAHQPARRRTANTPTASTPTAGATPRPLPPSSGHNGSSAAAFVRLRGLEKKPTSANESHSLKRE